MKATLVLLAWCIGLTALLTIVAALMYSFRPEQECSVTLYDGTGNIAHEIIGKVRT